MPAAQIACHLIRFFISKFGAYQSTSVLLFSGTSNLYMKPSMWVRRGQTWFSVFRASLVLSGVVIFCYYKDASARRFARHTRFDEPSASQKRGWHEWHCFGWRKTFHSNELSLFCRRRRSSFLSCVINAYWSRRRLTTRGSNRPSRWPTWQLAICRSSNEEYCLILLTERIKAISCQLAKMYWQALTKLICRGALL